MIPEHLLKRMCMLYVSHEGMSNVVRGERMDDTKNVKEKKKECYVSEMLKGEEVPSNLEDEAAWRRKKKKRLERDPAAL